MIFTTALNEYKTTNLTPYARSLLDDVDAATARLTLEILSAAEIIATYAPLISPQLTGTPQAVTVEDLDDNSDKIATTAFVAATIRRLMGVTPAELDTLQELATAINQDPNFATTMATALAGKQPLHDALTSISGLTTAANKIIYTTASNVYETTDLTPYARSFLDDADAATARATLEVTSTADLQEKYTLKPIRKAITISTSGWQLCN